MAAALRAGEDRNAQNGFVGSDAGTTWLPSFGLAEVRNRNGAEPGGITKVWPPPSRSAADHNDDTVLSCTGGATVAAVFVDGGVAQHQQGHIAYDVAGVVVRC
ncbi:hypothetical protein [Actinacidiphila acididurans]|uniref:Uncharacterized protein n=1 Tax=Actinacidiphila acididurans TaxID=2784346 RepID=A0ABS2TXA0_9ACTN|nr:hypothetical protein [Actinacidiphila acididurans]MBM9507973.1 hypothetical protein [Actinacidiphila acididurans]